MRPLVEKHIEEALLKPWPVSEPECPGVSPTWSIEKRANCFFMGTVLPLLCLAYPLVVAGPWRLWQALEFSFQTSVWALLFHLLLISAVLPILLSSACMAVCCVRPGRRDDVWVRRGLLLGCATWGLIFIVLVIPTFLLIFIPSIVVGGVVSLITYWGAKLFCSQYRFSIASILKLTCWCALVAVVIRLVPGNYWNAAFIMQGTIFWLVAATPGLAWYAFWTTTSDVISGN